MWILIGAMAGLLVMAGGIFATSAISAKVLDFTTSISEPRWWHMPAWMAFGICASLPLFGLSLALGILAFFAISGISS